MTEADRGNFSAMRPDRTEGSAPIIAGSWGTSGPEVVVGGRGRDVEHTITFGAVSLACRPVFALNQHRTVTTPTVTREERFA
jgi:hypothetical protein